MSIRTLSTRPRVIPSAHELPARGRRAAPGLVIALCAALLTSCGGGSEDDSDSPDGSSAEKAKVEAQDARKKAEEASAADVFPDNFAKAVERLDDGDDLLESGEYGKAKQKYRYAERSFDDLAKKAAAFVAKYDEAMKFKEEVDNFMQQAIAAGAQTTAATDFADIQKRYKVVMDGIESLDSAKIDSAKRNLTRIRDDFQDLVRTARQNAVVKEKAVKEREAMAKIKVAAKENPAVAEHAAQDLIYGEQAEREADSDFEAGNFQRALSGYQLAGQNFTAAIERAENMKKLLASTASPAPGAPGAAPAIPRPASGEIRPAPAEPTPGAADAPDPFAGLELSAEDLAVAENIKSLLPSFGKKSVYDPATRAVTLDYSSAALLREDIAPVPRNNSKYLDFKDPFMAGSPSGPGGGGGGAEGQSFSFTGNTRGLFLIPLPMTGDISFEYTVNLMTMDQNGMMGPVLLSDEKGRTAWWADFVTLKRVVRGNTSAQQPLNPEYRKNANYWFDKVNPVPMRVEARADEKKEGYHRIYIYYNGESEPSNISAPYKSGSVGYVGWSWSRAKFVIRDLRITGTLDIPEAAKILKEKGVKIEEPPAEDPPGDGPGDAEEPTTPKEEKKKEDGGFDF